MANEEHLKILKQGLVVWNRWREENPDVRPDLSEADLRGADLREANLFRANLFRANLVETNLSGGDLLEANLSGAHLAGADLSSAFLRKVDLFGADLLIADLSGADLSMADLSRASFLGGSLQRVYLGGAHFLEANLFGADLSEATLLSTVFADMDLSGTKGLETVRHKGPSTIGIDTIHRSGGKMPEAFLRGCGVPDTFIAYVASLTDQAIQYHSCFISYSTKDEDFAQRLHADLQQKGVRCWFAPEDIRGGEKLYDQIDQAIRLHDKLLLVLSEHSIHSEWVTTEIRRARKAEARDERRKLFPIRLVDWETIQDWECFDADTVKDLAVEVREYFVPDSSHWKDYDSYQQAFDRLLRDLKASEA